MRKTDTDKKFRFRSADRVFQANNNWWFAARQGDQGPFRSRREAQEALTKFILDVRGDIELNEVSVLDKADLNTASAWDLRPDVIR